jgi:GDP-4-dehydro-6-deoxy-D-mannose reductase
VPETHDLPFSSVLITGAEGFVGGYLIRRLVPLLRDGARLVLGSRNPAAQASEGEFVRLDITDKTSVRRVFETYTPDLVIHLAAQSSVGASGNNPRSSWDVNLRGTFNLGEAMADLGSASTMLFASSAEVYGRAFNSGIVDEDTYPQPSSVYGRSKAAAEAMLGDILSDLVKLIIVRPCNHSGAGQDDRFVVPSFARQIARAEAGLAETVVRVGNLEAERDFLHVEDVVGAYIRLLQESHALPSKSIFNVASGHPVRISEILEQLVARSKVDLTIEQDLARMRPSEVPVAALSDRRLCDLGWHREHNLAEMLDGVLDYERMRVASGLA